jgi:hypothetical protein
MELDNTGETGDVSVDIGELERLAYTIAELIVGEVNRRINNEVIREWRVAHAWEEEQARLGRLAKTAGS